MQKQNSNMRNWNNSLKDPDFFFLMFARYLTTVEPHFYRETIIWC